MVVGKATFLLGFRLIFHGELLVWGEGMKILDLHWEILLDKASGLHLLGWLKRAGNEFISYSPGVHMAHDFVFNKVTRFF